MRADELLVERFLEKEKECEALKDMNYCLREDNRKLEDAFKKLKKMVKLEETSTGEGYQIVLYHNGSYQGTIAYCWDKNDIPQDFLELLEIFGLDLPLPEPNVEELENDRELFNKAMEKAKELQKQQESENK